jgi:hypothetical protein
VRKGPPQLPTTSKPSWHPSVRTMAKACKQTYMPCSISLHKLWRTLAQAEGEQALLWLASFASSKAAIPTLSSTRAITASTLVRVANCRQAPVTPTHHSGDASSLCRWQRVHGCFHPHCNPLGKSDTTSNHTAPEATLRRGPSCSAQP